VTSSNKEEETPRKSPAEQERRNKEDLGGKRDWSSRPEEMGSSLLTLYI